MTIKELIKEQLDDVAASQSRYQAIVLQAMLEEGFKNREKVIEKVRPQIERLGTKIVIRSVDLGMRWLKNGKV